MIKAFSEIYSWGGGRKKFSIKLNKVRSKNILLYWRILAVTMAMIRKVPLAKNSPEGKCLNSSRSLAFMLIGIVQ